MSTQLGNPFNQSCDNCWAGTFKEGYKTTVNNLIYYYCSAGCQREHYKNLTSSQPLEQTEEHDARKHIEENKTGFFPEFLDFMKVVEFGASKYEMNGWLQPDGKGTSHKQMHDSMFHHLAQSYAGKRLDDGEGGSGLNHLLHIACRSLMLYVRLKRDIKNPND